MDTYSGWAGSDWQKESSSSLNEDVTIVDLRSENWRGRYIGKIDMMEGCNYWLASAFESFLSSASLFISWSHFFVSGSGIRVPRGRFNESNSASFFYSPPLLRLPRQTLSSVGVTLFRCFCVSLASPTNKVVPAPFFSSHLHCWCSPSGFQGTPQIQMSLFKLLFRGPGFTTVESYTLQM